MSHHTVTEKEISDWINAEAWHQAASSHGSGASKSLDWDGRGTFRVIDHGKTAFLGNDLTAAVAAYNNAR